MELQDQAGVAARNTPKAAELIAAGRSLTSAVVILTARPSRFSPELITSTTTGPKANYTITTATFPQQ